MDELVMQNHLMHYKQATETAREELAAIQSKYQSAHSQLLDTRAKLASQEATVQELREAVEGYKEAVARQASLVSTLRERIHNTEQEMESITSSKTLMDTKLQALMKENQEMKERELHFDMKLKHYHSELNKAKQDAANSAKRYHEFTTTLAEKVPISLGGDDCMESIISVVDACWRERDSQRERISILEERVRSHEVESKASRETVMRLVSEVDHEKKISSNYTNDLTAVRQEKENVLLQKRSVEKECESLRNKLQAAEHVLTVTRREADRLERNSQDLEDQLQSSQKETQATHSHLQALISEMMTLLNDQHSTALLTKEHALERLKDLCSRETSTRECVLELEARLLELAEELARQQEQQQAAVQRAEQAEQCEKERHARLQSLENELLSTSVRHDSLSQEQQHYHQFIEQLSEKMQVNLIVADEGMDMRLQVILSRAEQMMKQEGTTLVECKMQLHSLQRKLRGQKERLESKDLYTELLRRKVTQLEEEKRSQSALAVVQDDTVVANKKLQKKVERLQAELSSIRISNTELKAQVAHTHELKIKVMEQAQTIEEKMKSVDKIEKRKEKVEKRFSALTTDLQQTKALLQSHTTAMTELAQGEKALLDFRAVVFNMLGVDEETPHPNHEVIKRLESLVSMCHAHLPLACHCAMHHCPTAPCSQMPQSALPTLWSRTGSSSSC